MNQPRTRSAALVAFSAAFIVGSRGRSRCPAASTAGGGRPHERSSSPRLRCRTSRGSSPRRRRHEARGGGSARPPRVGVLDRQLDLRGRGADPFAVGRRFQRQVGSVSFAYRAALRVPLRDRPRRRRRTLRSVLQPGRGAFIRDVITGQMPRSSEDEVGNQTLPA
jgi:hypothetical protein